MIKTDIPLYLASKSPRRKKLLQQIGLKFDVMEIDVEEDINEGETPAEMVIRLALDKMNAARKKINRGIIITADTTVVLDGNIIGKPVDADDAVRILKTLSGRTHTVYTGFSVYNTENKNHITDLEKTDVTFIDIREDDIRDYIKSGNPMDKAGAYGIQDDFGAVFVKKISGCYYNVVGLPLSKIYSCIEGII
jgi:septum formation protein